MVFKPSWVDLRRVVSAASNDLRLYSPYFSKEGIGQVFDSLAAGVNVHFHTRLSPSDWANGVADPEELLALFELLESDGRQPQLHVCQRLHAKLYVADEDLALMGSANLSQGGFVGNIELAAWLEGADVAHALETISDCLRSHVRVLQVAELRRWIDEAREDVLASRREAAERSADLSRPQALLDKILGHGAGTGVIAPPTSAELVSFLEWLALNRELPGAAVLHDRSTNATGQQLQGHVKQCMAAALRFFRERADMVQAYSASIAGLDSDDIFSPSEELLEPWLEHFDSQATAAGEWWSYPTLRSILPPSLGGTVAAGGGGSSTLKRMLPIVARFLER